MSDFLSILYFYSKRIMFVNYQSVHKRKCINSMVNKQKLFYRLWISRPVQFFRCTQLTWNSYNQWIGKRKKLHKTIQNLFCIYIYIYIYIYVCLYRDNSIKCEHSYVYVRDDIYRYIHIQMKAIYHVQNFEAPFFVLENEQRNAQLNNNNSNNNKKTPKK